MYIHLYIFYKIKYVQTNLLFLSEFDYVKCISVILCFNRFIFLPKKSTKGSNDIFFIYIYIFCFSKTQMMLLNY